MLTSKNKRRGTVVRAAAAAVVAGERLEPRCLLSGVAAASEVTHEPTPFEQQMLERINRFRADPSGEVGLLFSSLDPLQARDPDVQDAIEFFGVDGAVLQEELATLAAAPPLAWNSALADAAQTHSQWMIDADEQSHQVPGEPDFPTRLANAGYELQPGDTAGENLFALAESVAHAHAGFVVDWGPLDEQDDGMQDPPGHRLNLVDADFVDVGLGILEDSSDETMVGPLVVTQNFGRNAASEPQLLGVAYEDTNRNGLFDAGEGLPGVTIEVEGSSGTFTTTTWGSGGYQLTVPPGTYIVRASGGPLDGTIVADGVELGSKNSKIDFLSVPTSETVGIVMRVVKSPTSVNAQGELDLLPQNTPTAHEWEDLFVEVYAISSAGSSLASAGVDLFYDPAYFTATDVAFGPGFPDAQSSEFDDETGTIEVSASTAPGATNVGDDRFTLLARVRLASLDGDDVPMKLDTQNFGPFDLGLDWGPATATLDDGRVVDQPLQHTLPDTELFPLALDFDDGDRIDFADVSRFVSVFQADVEDSTSPYALPADVDGDGRVDFGDFTFFVSGFGLGAGDAVPIPAGYYDGLRRGTGGGGGAPLSASIDGANATADVVEQPAPVSPNASPREPEVLAAVADSSPEVAFDASRAERRPPARVPLPATVPSSRAADPADTGERRESRAPADRRTTEQRPDLVAELGERLLRELDPFGERP